MTGLDVSYLGAFGAGVLSFLSPCVLPLVPPYLCYLAGMTLDDLLAEDGTAAATRKRVLRSALGFVLGFSTVFILLGATASALGQLVIDQIDLLSKIAGGIIIVLGLHFLGVFRIAPLFRDLRFQTATPPAGPLGAYVVGLAFAFGWTPCVGPILATILVIAGSEGSVGQGVALLSVYSAGLAIPFLLAATAVGPFMRFFQDFRQRLVWVERIIGGLLVLTGVLFLTGGINTLAYWLLEAFPILGKTG